ncbi:RHS repeat-associated core domain protein [[Leptolyngbya] sp. PCC 7376]|uniref:CARDB domain-containing protein n=1 Tax=[Leptolyngbya] sp. PCC 7376 TaxID=111781 RepID=UPI00029F40DD|nr:CARDB domain-containing protein [[Leptolyngbya] sp. PCC 7376]AFY39930.1 RHS repeat-associated core domain protein [[Leptolyngbya] sp. PCC 7376]
MPQRIWDNVVGGFWDIADNWSDDIVPNVGDEVLIDLEGLIETTHRTGNTFISSLISEASLAISGGSLTVEGNLEINAPLRILSGSLVLNGSGSLGGFELSGGLLSGAGNIGVESNSIWTGGTYNGTGLALLANATLEATGGNKDFSGGIIETQGTTLWDAGQIRASNSATWNNTSTAVFDIQGDLFFDHLNSSGAVPVINNAGILRKSAGNSTATIEAQLNNSGVIDVQSGLLRPTGGITLNDGSQITGDGKVLVNANTLTLDGIISSSGTLEFSSGSLIGDAELDNLTWTGGTYNSTGLKLIEGGTLTLAGGTKTFAGILETNGQTNWQSGTIRTNNTPATWNNTATGVLDIQDGLTFENASTGDTVVPIINNDGTLRKSGSAGTTTIQAQLNNSGVIDVQVGVLNSTFGVTLNNGSQITGNGKVLVNANTLTLDGTISSSGTLEFSSGSLIGDAELDNLTWTGGTYNSTGLKLIEGGTLTLAGGTKTFAGILETNGQTNWQSGTIRTNNTPATWNNTATGVLDIQDGLTFENASTGDTVVPIINNAGTLRKSGGAGTAAIQAQLNNSGIIDIQSGILNPTFGVTLNNGSQITGDGKVLVNANTLTLDGIISSSGTLEFSGGSLIGDAELDNLTWTGGTYNSTGLKLIEGGTLKATGGNKNFDGGILETQGTTIWDSGEIQAWNGATWNNTSTAVFDIQGDLYLEHYFDSGAVPVINNAGTLRKSAGNGTATIEAQVNNIGGVDVQSGTLSLLGGFTQSAGITRLAGGSLSASSPLDIQGGSLEGFGLLNASISSSGEINPGVGIGTLNLVGNYTQSATGTINFEIGGREVTAVDRLNIDGNANFDGTLNISFIDGFNPLLGETFTVATFDSFTGDFANITVEGLIGDAVDYEIETLFENNQLILSITDPDFDGPDLQVNSVTSALGTGTLGDDIELSWTVSNQGDVPTLAGWSDRLYLSTDTALSADDRLLFTQPIDNFTVLDPGQDYTQNATVTLPLDTSTAPGNYYLLVETDGLGDRPETNEVNNVTASDAVIDLTLPTDLPDVVVSAIVVPTETVAGQAVQIKWTLTNQGGRPASGTWTDTVYASSDDAIGQDISLASFEFNGSIGAGESLERVQTITIPSNIQSNQHIVVTTDANNQLFEQSDANNTAISDQAITVLQPTIPNLQISSVTPPAQAFSNQSTVVNWTVTNAGTGAAGEWYDQVWLSLEPRTELGPDQLPIPTDIFLGQIQNAGYLEPGQSYSSSLEVTLPEGLDGNYYFVVYSNIEEWSAGRHHGLGRLLESDRTDNLGLGASTQVNLTPPPDLQVLDVQASTQGFSGETTSITWTVSNEGIGTTLRHNGLGFFIQSTLTESFGFGDAWDPLDISWQDKLYLSADQELDSEDILLGTFSYDGPLTSGESYTKTQNVTLPIGISGNFFVIAETDVLQPNPGLYGVSFGSSSLRDAVFEGGFEDNNQNHTVTPIQVNLTPPPDLGVEILAAPTGATASRSLVINYRVTNDGSTTTPNSSWQDAFYLSSTPDFDPDTALKLREVTHSGRLDPETTYENSVSLTLPNEVSGEYFIFVVTDSNNAVFELDDVAEGSNADVSPNLVSQTITITSQPADLVISDANTPATAEAGQATRVEWTVTNEGTGDTSVTSWVDRVIISDNDILGDEDDQILATFNQTGLLDVGESYTRNELVTFPNTFAGDKYLFVVTDARNNVYEAAQEDNNASDGLPVTLPELSESLANLEVTAVNSPTVARGAEFLTISWTVENTGVGSTDSTVWYDNVYLSSDPTLDKDNAILLGEIRHTNPLESGQEYTAQQTFIVPPNAEGDFYVFVEADSRNQVTEPTEGGNIASTAEATRVVAFQTADPELPPVETIDPDVVELPVDLSVVAVEAPSDGNSGQPLEISWTVQNNGEAIGSRTWYDAVYLSQDQVFDPNTDNYLGAVERTGLGAGESYQVTKSFDVSVGLSGPLYAFVVTDSTERLNDTDRTNNVTLDSTAIQVLPIPPDDYDLAVGTIAVPATSISGEATTISYTVTNEGTATISGTWFDTVYLSADNQWDIGDAVLGQIQVSETLGNGESYAQDLTVTLPGVLPGDYHVIVRSDIRNTFAEVDETNNVAVSAEQITTDISALTLGNTVESTLADGQSTYYRVDVAAGEILKVELDSDSASATNTLAIRYGDVPTRSEFDFSETNPFGSDVELVFPNTKAGTYYIQAFGTQVPEGSAGFSLTADVLDFSLSDIGSDSGSNKGQVTLTLKGAKFTPDTIAKVIADNGTEREATNLIWKDETEIWATFDLQGLETGLYDVVVADGNVVTSLDDSFTVNDGPVGNLQVQVISPEAVRPGQSGTVQVIYTNTGETDITAPVLAIDAYYAELAEQRVSSFQTSDGRFFTSQIALSDEDFTKQPIQFLGINSDGPAGILAPGDSGNVSFAFRHVLSDETIPQELVPTIDLGEGSGGPVSSPPIAFFASALEEDLAINWLDFKDAFKPLGYSDAAWDVVYDNFVAEIGDDTTSFQELVAENATYLAALGESTNDIGELLTAELQQVSQYQALAQQLRIGSLGQGQSFIGDVQVLEDEDGNVVIDYNGVLRLFEQQTDGSYQGQPGDNGVLTQVGSGYQLRELDGTITTFQGDGRIVSVQDPNNNQITFVRDANQNNRLIRLAFSTGDFIDYTYNAFGRIEIATDHAGVQTTFGYDPTGQFLSQVTTPAGTISYEYENGLLSKFTDATGVSVEFEYDSRGRIISQSLTNGESTLNYVYNSTGGITVTDENGVETELILNAQGQVSQINDPLGNTLELQYDARGNLIGLQGPDSATLDYGYDAFGNLIRQTNPLGNDIQFSYDSAFNNLASVTDENGNPVQYSYDDRGNLEAITYADGSVEKFVSDAQGNIERYTNRRNIPIDFEHNDRGQITRIDFQDGDYIEYQYNDLGQLTVAAESRDGIDSSINFTYDSETNFLERIDYPNGRFLAYEFDGAGRRTRLEDQDGNVVNYQYDDAGRLDQLRDVTDSLIVQYQYDALGRLEREDKGNGTYTSYQYDDAGRLVKLIHYAPDGSTNSSFEYIYNDLGLQTGVTNIDGNWSYTYDALGQLSGAVFESTNPAIENQNITYEYDASGNRRRTIVNGETTNYAANNLNQYTSAGTVVYDYDADGNLISKVDDDGQSTFNYDDFNRLVSIEEPGGVFTEYVYDALGNRVASISDGERIDYLVDPIGLLQLPTFQSDNPLFNLVDLYSPLSSPRLSNVVGEYYGDENNAVQYVHGLGLESQSNNSGVVSFYNFNAIGSTAQLTDSSGEILNRYSYSPFGIRLTDEEQIANPFEFIGQYGVMESTSNLDFMRARFYDSQLGRFVSNDPRGFEGGSPNLYKYANNSPANYSDPEGEFVITLSVGTVLAVSAGIGFIYGVQSSPEEYENLGGFQDARNGALGIGGLTVALQTLGAAFPALEVGYVGGLYFGLAPAAPLFAGIGGALLLGNLLGKGSLYIASNFDRLWDTWAYRYLSGAFSNLLSGIDPNDIIGPSGIGDDNWLTAETTLPYIIRFENLPEATGAAQEVVITHPLDPDLDWRTFRLGSFGWGDFTFEIPENRSFYQERIDFTEEYGFLVDVVARIDVIEGVATWTITTIDPETGQKTNDAFVGFLPPNDEEAIGEGFVTYTIQVDDDVETGAVIDAQATIVFDTEAPIDTPPIFNTIDAGAPSSTIDVLPTTSDVPEFLVSWTGTDDDNGSGIAGYTVYVSENGGEYIPWLEDTQLTEATYLGELGKTYQFYVVAIDNAGNRQQGPEEAQASVFVRSSNELPVLSVNESLDVNEDMTATITADELQVTDADNTPEQLTFTVTDLPNHGDLLLNNVALTLNGTFTQDDIDNDLLSYINNGTANTIDSFNFTVFDGVDGNIGTNTFAINIIPANNAPEVTNPLADLTIEEGAENSVINLSDVFSDENGDEITFSIVSNSNSDLVIATIDNGQLILDYQDNQTGSAEITIAGDDGKGGIVEDVFEIDIPEFDPLTGMTTEVYRFYRKDAGSHLYTSDPNEIAVFRANPGIFTEEAGVATNGAIFLAGNAPSDGLKAVRRFYNKQTNGHFFTSDTNEIAAVQANQVAAGVFRDEGVAFYALEDSIPDLATDVYRFSNINTGAHFFTNSIIERDIVIANQVAAGFFRFEGVGWEAIA